MATRGALKCTAQIWHSGRGARAARAQAVHKQDRQARSWQPGGQQRQRPPPWPAHAPHPGTCTHMVLLGIRRGQVLGAALHLALALREAPPVPLAACQGVHRELRALVAVGTPLLRWLLRRLGCLVSAAGGAHRRSRRRRWPRKVWRAGGRARFGGWLLLGAACRRRQALPAVLGPGQPWDSHGHCACPGPHGRLSLTGGRGSGLVRPAR